MIYYSQFSTNNLASVAKHLNGSKATYKPNLFRVQIGKDCLHPQQLHFSVPQGSCSGANLFTCYCLVTEQAVLKDITLNGFADDHSLKKSFQLAAKHKNNKANHATYLQQHLKMDGQYAAKIKFR